MSFHVLFREFDTDREDTDSEDNTGKFQCDRIDSVLITVAPPAGIEDIGTVWTYTNSSSQSVIVAMVRHGSVSDAKSEENIWSFHWAGGVYGASHEDK